MTPYLNPTLDQQTPKMDILFGCHSDNHHLLKTVERLNLLDDPSFSKKFNPTTRYSGINLLLEARHLAVKDETTSTGAILTNQVASICGDTYLRNKKELQTKLGIHSKLSDLETALQAYLKWELRLVEHLSGDFLIVIFDHRHQALHLITDHIGHRPCFYTHQKGNLFFSNQMSPIAKASPKLTTDYRQFGNIALNISSMMHTCYQEIKIMPPAHILTHKAGTTTLKQYWSPSTLKRTSLIRTRKYYYDEFKQHFEQSVKSCLDTQDNTCSLLSGGLDSAAITAQAALLLQRHNKSLISCTSTPKHLRGQSYRKGWQYEESRIIDNLIQQHSNIRHTYITNNDNDGLAIAEQLFKYTCQPVNNIANASWYIDCLNHAQTHNCSIVLEGMKGNNSVSWKGTSSIKAPLRLIKSALRKKLKATPPHQNFVKKDTKFYSYTNRTQHKNHNLGQNVKITRLFGIERSFKLSVRTPITTAHGVQILDPTDTLEILNFCYNTPNYAFASSQRDVLKKRLLIRKGLKHILPTSTTHNPYRGAQAPEWYTFYNRHVDTWKDRILQLPQSSADVIWNIYDKDQIIACINKYKYISENNAEVVSTVRHKLLGSLSKILFMDFVISDRHRK